jgi:hypothetical protein
MGYLDEFGLWANQTLGHCKQLVTGTDNPEMAHDALTHWTSQLTYTYMLYQVYNIYQEPQNVVAPLLSLAFMSAILPLWQRKLVQRQVRDKVADRLARAYQVASKEDKTAIKDRLIRAGMPETDINDFLKPSTVPNPM